jgi:hypothetical protein
MALFLFLIPITFRGIQWQQPSTSDPRIHEVFREQARVGNTQVLYGWWTKGWAEVQHAYLVSLSRQTTGRRWLSRLIKKQWEVSWDLWRHRLQVAATPDSFSLSLAHDHINEEIRALYFRQPLPLLLEQPMAFKQDWIVMVRLFLCP